MTRPLVIGATGLVGGMILGRLVAAGERPIGLSRNPPDMAGVDWMAADLTGLADTVFPPLSTVFATCPASVLAAAVPVLASFGMTRLVTLTSTSLETKQNSPDLVERENIRRWAEDERRVIENCGQHNVAWTILRPTMIYAEGRDANVSRIAALIRRFHFFPLSGGGKGLRQPVHAEDLAQAAIAAASRDCSVGRIYNVPGGETLPYREMVGRIFDGLGMPRIIIPVPRLIWTLASPLTARYLPGVSAAVTARMAKDMTFDLAPAATDLDWHPRTFRPRFTS